MRLKKARVTQYRSIRDSGWFEIETDKTILVGPNEAGKTALLQALQQINPPEGVPRFDPLRDYPRSEYNDITTGRVKPRNVTVVEAHFCLEDDDCAVVGKEFADATYILGRKLDNECWHRIEGGPEALTFGGIKKDLVRLAAHVAKQSGEIDPPAKRLAELTDGWSDSESLPEGGNAALRAWLTALLPQIDEENATEERRYDRLTESLNRAEQLDGVPDQLYGRLPVLVLFGNYFRVRPNIHLEHLAIRLEKNLLDDRFYDYGNQCLLSLLGFSARDLSNLGKAPEPAAGDPDALKSYRDQLDKRSYQLNAASVRLTEEIRNVWAPDPKRAEADRLRVTADAQYLKVVVEDELGVEIELDQRSEGFQWLVSFFVVFFAEAADKHDNAILLLDEPGLSLHGLKQREFRETVSRLSKANQTLYTTHSPFLVGPGELDLVRVVEMVDRRVGTHVHTTVTAEDPASLLPLQEALGYDLAQSLFAQQRNLVLEGLTDYWYVDAVSQLLRESGRAELNERIAFVPAASAGKVVYYATILHAQKLKVAALLDSDAAGDQAAQQDTLVHVLGNNRILRTRDTYQGPVSKPEIEDTLRETLVAVAKADLGWDVESTASSQPKRPIVELFASEISDFSKYKLAKAFLRWTRFHDASDLTPDELQAWEDLIVAINKALK